LKLHVLGCSGGIGGSGQFARTTSFLIDDDILIDAGTGIEDLTVAELTRIDHVFLTHSHLDHIAGLPLMVDSVGARRDKPLVVHALPETIEALRTHVFNWVIWPDFTQIPHYERPWMRFEPIGLGESLTLDGRVFRGLPANHTVPALGYQVSSDSGALVFSGDSWPTDEFWRVVNGVPNLRHLIIETAFPNRERDLAITAKHLHPIELGEQLRSLRGEPEIWVSHTKPSDADLIAREVDAWAGRFRPQMLARGQVLEF
jgi:ribonuclease BN (tRNA processing enzyme)